MESKFIYGGQPKKADAGEIGTYMPCPNNAGGGLFILNTVTGQCWWTNERNWERPDKGGAEGGEIGTYMTYNNDDGAGIIILNTRTGEGWWTNVSDWDFFGKPSAGMPPPHRDPTQKQFILRISDPEPGMPYGTMVLNDQVVSMEMLLGYFHRATS